MTTISKKRQRSENWLEDDKLLLKVLVMEKVEAIENKNMDANSNARKVEAWTELQNCFNTMCKGGTRTITQLKNQWGAIKAMEKRKKADESGSLVKTDDESSAPPERDPANPNNIKVWLPQEIVDNKESDSDTSNQVQTPSPNVQPKKPGTKKEVSSSTDLAADIVKCELICRRELHAKQMENETIKKDNLLLEQQLLRKKLDYYDEKINTLYI